MGRKENGSEFLYTEVILYSGYTVQFILYNVIYAKIPTHSCSDTWRYHAV